MRRHKEPLVVAQLNSDAIFASFGLVLEGPAYTSRNNEGTELDRYRATIRTNCKILAGDRDADAIADVAHLREVSLQTALVDGAERLVMATKVVGNEVHHVANLAGLDRIDCLGDDHVGGPFGSYRRLPFEDHEQRNDDEDTCGDLNIARWHLHETTIAVHL